MIPNRQRLRLLQDQLTRIWDRWQLCIDVKDRAGIRINQSHYERLEEAERELLADIRAFGGMEARR